MESKGRFLPRLFFLTLLFCRYSLKLLPGLAKYYLRFFLHLHRLSYLCISTSSQVFYRGAHPKHLFMKEFHDFFVDNIREGQRVLDIGCGSGQLAVACANKAAEIVGIDIEPRNIDRALKENAAPNITYLVGDATTDIPPDRHFDVAILSNVLEHIEDSVGLLRNLSRQVDKLLIRVPRLDSYWTVYVRRDLGMFYFSDPTHFREYTRDSVIEELDKAGWTTLFITGEIEPGTYYAIAGHKGQEDA